MPLLARQQPPPAAAVEPTRFTVLLQGRPLGTELVRLTESADGWLISATNSLAAPFNIETTKFLLRYTHDWQPQSLAIEGLVNGQLLTLSTAFTTSMATSEGIQGGRPISVTRNVSAGAVVLPNGFYGPYEAVAARLATAAVGATFQVFVAPQAEVTATVQRITPHHVTTAAGAADFRAFELSLANPGGALAVEVWIDARNRLARVAIPAPGLTVIRDDIAGVTTRDEPISRPGDEDVFISSTGFNLAGVLSKPAGAAGRLAAVVLIGGSGPTDRDEKVAGIAIFAQLAAGLADAGFAVIRYDKRGVGQSGGRIESATLDDYADDAVNVYQWLARRRDVDKKRIALIGHSEGGAVALLALKHAKDVAGVCLIAAPGATGREITLEQQRHLLERANEPEDSRKAKTDLELRIIDAVTKGATWDDIPPELRRQADTPWFRSWLLYDPAVAIKNAKQPILIVQGALDTQVPPAQADRLEALSRARKNTPASATRRVVVPDVNHLLVPAKTGEVDEYASLAGSRVSPGIMSAITDWLKSTLTPPAGVR